MWKEAYLVSSLALKQIQLTELLLAQNTSILMFSDSILIYSILILNNSSEELIGHYNLEKNQNKNYIKIEMTVIL